MFERISGQSGLGSVMKQKSLYKVYGQDQPVTATDAAEISPFAKELGRVMGELENIPEVRMDKVNEIRKRIEEGTYNPDLSLVARGIMLAGLLNGED